MATRYTFHYSAVIALNEEVLERILRAQQRQAARDGADVAVIDVPRGPHTNLGGGEAHTLQLMPSVSLDPTLLPDPSRYAIGQAAIELDLRSRVWGNADGVRFVPFTYSGGFQLILRDVAGNPTILGLDAASDASPPSVVRILPGCIPPLLDFLLSDDWEAWLSGTITSAINLRILAGELQWPLEVGGDLVEMLRSTPCCEWRPMIHFDGRLARGFDRTVLVLGAFERRDRLDEAWEVAPETRGEAAELSSFLPSQYDLGMRLPRDVFDRAAREHLDRTFLHFDIWVPSVVGDHTVHGVTLTRHSPLGEPAEVTLRGEPNPGRANLRFRAHIRHWGAAVDDLVEPGTVIQCAADGSFEATLIAAYGDSVVFRERRLRVEVDEGGVHLLLNAEEPSLHLGDGELLVSTEATVAVEMAEGAWLDCGTVEVELPLALDVDWIDDPDGPGWKPRVVPRLARDPRAHASLDMLMMAHLLGVSVLAVAAAVAGPASGIIGVIDLAAVLAAAPTTLLALSALIDPLATGALRGRSILDNMMDLPFDLGGLSDAVAGLGTMAFLPERVEVTSGGLGVLGQIEADDVDPDHSYEVAVDVDDARTIVLLRLQVSERHDSIEASASCRGSGSTEQRSQVSLLLTRTWRDTFYLSTDGVGLVDLGRISPTDTSRFTSISVEGLLGASGATRTLADRVDFDDVADMDGRMVAVWLSERRLVKVLLRASPVHTVMARIVVFNEIPSREVVIAGQWCKDQSDEVEHAGRLETRRTGANHYWLRATGGGSRGAPAHGQRAGRGPLPATHDHQSVALLHIPVVGERGRRLPTGGRGHGLQPAGRHAALAGRAGQLRGPPRSRGRGRLRPDCHGPAGPPRVEAHRDERVRGARSRAIRTPAWPAAPGAQGRRRRGPPVGRGRAARASGADRRIRGRDR